MHKRRVQGERGVRECSGDCVPGVPDFEGLQESSSNDDEAEGFDVLTITVDCCCKGPEVGGAQHSPRTHLNCNQLSPVTRCPPSFHQVLVICFFKVTSFSHERFVADRQLKEP